jgi:pimeloyl-ACP methyl ester carboxylesterase
VTKVPFWGDLRKSERYQQADRALKANPQVTRVVGHSLGGAVSLQLQKDKPGLASRTYGAPVFDPLGLDSKAERYRNVGDPVSIFDRSARKSIHPHPFSSLSGPHDYSNIAANHMSEGTAAVANKDGSVSITE